jgi:hypothetical protein
MHQILPNKKPQRWFLLVNKSFQGTVRISKNRNQILGDLPNLNSVRLTALTSKGGGVLV